MMALAAFLLAASWVGAFWLGWTVGRRLRCRNVMIPPEFSDDARLVEALAEISAARRDAWPFRFRRIKP